jgi:His/Glu/Gln/Arg/opine family amino acid ABC transporter permease subunit
MAHVYSEEDYYVAPGTPPPSRRPPLTTVGPLGWLRHNLFSSPLNTIATLVMSGLIIWFMGSLLVWSITSAQWSVVFNNLRQITSGPYKLEEIWRVELIAGALMLLTGLSLGIWGAIGRGVFIAVAVVLAVMLLVPLLGAQIPDPGLYILVEPEPAPFNLVFVGERNQEITFSLRSLTTPSGMPMGYIDIQSRAEWSTRVNEARSGKLDLTRYNLKVTVRLVDEDGNPVVDENGPVELVAGQEGGSRQTELPHAGWYVVQINRDDTDKTNNAGFAWVKVEGVKVAPTGADPAYDNAPKIARGLLPNDKSYLFEGTRNAAEFIDLQLAPFFENISKEMVIGSAILFNGWLIGLYGRRRRSLRRAAVIAWLLAIPLVPTILSGFESSETLPYVSSSVWGGLMLTLILTFVGITASFPLGVALALGRRSDLPAVKWTCTLFIEMVRGVPLITILFMAKQIIPFFSSALSGIDLTVRMMIGVTLFSAAYLAENVRGGLQIIPHGQIEAARALGMNSLLTTSLIVLPQALRAVIPAIVGQFIALFKDTSLVAIVGLFELVGIVDTIVSGQPAYRPYQREAYIFIAIVYFAISYAMSDVSRRLETTGAGSVRR